MPWLNRAAASYRVTEAAEIRIGLRVMFPMSARQHLPNRSPLGTILASSLRQVAADAAGTALGREGVQIAGYDRTSHAIFHLPTASDGSRDACMPPGHGWESMDSFLRHFARQARSPFNGNSNVLVFVSGAYLLRDYQRLQPLLVGAVRNGLSCAGSSDGSLYAVALALHEYAPACGRLKPLLGRLVSLTRPTGAIGETDPPRQEWEPVENTGPMKSPTLAGTEPHPTVQPADAPAFLNAALAEAILHPARHEPIDCDDDLRQALIAQREVSSVRWIFNALLNIVEYGMSHPQPESVPPEVHIATNASCNIECRFCSYSHRTSSKRRVSAAQLMKLDWLRDIHTLRLSAGNGEPTINPQLHELIRYVGASFPHVSMNFFTNGILLDHAGLIPALVGSSVGWISVSLNAANAASWQRLCGADHFGRITRNLSSLLEEKRRRRSPTPVVFGSMVMTRDTVYELPLMPELCRRVGIDRFTAIPFFALGNYANDRLAATDAYHHVGADYDAIYHQTVVHASRWKVSIELPAPGEGKPASFGLESRRFHDFAATESHDQTWWKLLASVTKSPARPPVCPYLWRQAAIGISCKTPAGTTGEHFMYPCLGPLATVNFAPQTAFGFPGHSEFMPLWRNKVFTALRESQRQSGREPVCDHCRSSDTRAPELTHPIRTMLDDFVRRHKLP